MKDKLENIIDDVLFPKRGIKRRTKLINKMVAEGIFKVRKKDGHIAYSDKFVDVMETIRQSLVTDGKITAPSYLREAIKGERSIKEGVKKAKVAALLYGYLCFREDKNPLLEHQFVFFGKWDLKEIEDRLSIILAFDEVAED